MTAPRAEADGRRPFPRLGVWSALPYVGGFVSDPIGAMLRVYAERGPLVSFELTAGKSQNGVVLAVGPRYNERVLGDPATFLSSGILLPGPEGSAQRRIRRGVVSMNGPRHAYYRKLLIPPLGRAKVDALVGRMAGIVQREARSWELGPTDLWPLCRRLAQNVAVATLFSAAGDDGLPDALGAADLINEHVRINGLAAVRGCPLNLPGLPYRAMLQNAERVEAHLVEWAGRRKGDTRRDDLLSIVVNAPDERGNPAADWLIASHILTLFGASYETCQTVLTWTLFLIAQHPDVAARLLDEVSALPSEPAALTAHLKTCVWLDAVLKEAMRLLPPVPMQVREAAVDTDLVDGEIAARTRVILSAFLTNRLPELYPDGDRFRPERWAGLAPSQYEYMVFSAGPRMCIGTWFAMTFLKVAVSEIVRGYRISVVPGARIDRHVSITMSPKRGIPITLHRQDRRFAASPVQGNIRQLMRFDA